MSGLSKGVLASIVVGATLLMASPKQAEARRWVYYPGVVAASPVMVAPAPVYSAYYPVYPRRAYRSYYAPGYVVPAYPTPYYYGYGY